MALKISVVSLLLAMECLTMCASSHSSANCERELVSKQQHYYSITTVYDSLVWLPWLLNERVAVLKQPQACFLSS